MKNLIRTFEYQFDLTATFDHLAEALVAKALDLGSFDLEVKMPDASTTLEHLLAQLVSTLKVTSLTVYGSADTLSAIPEHLPCGKAVVKHATDIDRSCVKVCAESNVQWHLTDLGWGLARWSSM